MQYKHTHRIETDVQTFWELFFDPRFNEAFYLDHLKFSTYRVLEDKTDADGTRHRRVECVPKIDIPPAARSFFGNSAGYTEIGRFDPHARRYYLSAIPAFGSDRIKLTSEIWTEAVGSNRIDRHVSGEAVIKIFGLTKLIEGVTEQQTREQYAQAAEFTTRWVQKKGGV